MPDDVRAAVVDVRNPFLNTQIYSVLRCKTSLLLRFNHGMEICAPERIRPYPTGRFLGGDVPDTSCQATIERSLRDKSHRFEMINFEVTTINSIFQTSVR